MKKNFLQGLIVLALLVFAGCKQAATTNEDTTATEMETSVDQGDFDKKVAAIRTFFQAHSDEDLETQTAMLSDSLQWSPTSYNGNKWLGKEEFIGALKGYHDTYESIRYHEGVVTADSTVGGFYSGSVFPVETAETSAQVIRVYGTWTATHTASGQEMGLKFFGLVSFDDEGKIATLSDYFDLNSVMPKETEE